MIHLLKNIANSLIFKEKKDSETYIKYLKSKGAKIGERVIFYDSKHSLVDTTRSYMIEIGDDVQITRGVVILTHDYGWAVTKGKYGSVLGSAGSVHIGNNVFIGMNTIILKGSNIGNNVIIGANSTVSGIVESDSVYAGSPAKKIMSIEEYYQKRIAKQIDEAYDLFDSYFTSFNKVPRKEEFDEFFFLFEDRKEELIKEFKLKMELINNYEFSYNVFQTQDSLQKFKSYDEFIKYCINRKENTK
ncbi:acyltransferase [Massilimicrobiota sp. SW1139]|uniref:acyltransferase n=1 Tax=Massilimicrobiota sp. SW1139 TaxID=2530043 RepID=UPI001439329F|nr:acyltransferase [Massilimicrobiota sp. SW1139]NJE45753.1 acyltransferase [Massilimicrobiota sp. SW1139]